MFGFHMARSKLKTGKGLRCILLLQQKAPLHSGRTDYYNSRLPINIASSKFLFTMIAYSSAFLIHSDSILASSLLLFHLDRPPPSSSRNIFFPCGRPSGRPPWMEGTGGRVGADGRAGRGQRPRRSRHVSLVVVTAVIFSWRDGRDPFPKKKTLPRLFLHP